VPTPLALCYRRTRTHADVPFLCTVLLSSTQGAGVMLSYPFSVPNLVPILCCVLGALEEAAHLLRLRPLLPSVLVLKLLYPCSVLTPRTQGAGGGGTLTNCAFSVLITFSVLYFCRVRTAPYPFSVLYLHCVRRALEEAAHFSRYALAIYTFYLYVFDRPLCGACDLCLYGTLGCARRFHLR
jgi:hypothetical protein